MIAIAPPVTPVTPQDQFLAMLQQIRKSARFAFRKKAPFIREELVAEVVANAYCAFTRLAQRDRSELAYATPLATYAIRQVRAGRRVGSRLNQRDITSPAMSKHRHIMIERLDRYDDHRQEWREILIEDKNAGPADTAAVRIDFAAWLHRLPGLRRRIAKRLARGESTSTTARLFGLSPARISQLRMELRESWRQMQGELSTASS